MCHEIFMCREIFLCFGCREIFLCFNDLVLCRRYLAAIPALKTCFRASLRHHAIIAAPLVGCPRGTTARMRSSSTPPISRAWSRRGRCLALGALRVRSALLGSAPTLGSARLRAYARLCSALRACSALRGSARTLGSARLCAHALLCSALRVRTAKLVGTNGKHRSEHLQRYSEHLQRTLSPSWAGHVGTCFAANNLVDKCHSTRSPNCSSYLARSRPLWARPCVRNTVWPANTPAQQ